MITDEQFKKTENRLLKYYKNIREITKLESKCIYLEQLIEETGRDIKEGNIPPIDPELNMGLAITEKVQTSPTGESYVEKEIERAIDRLNKQWIELRHKRLNFKCRIRALKKENYDLENTINEMEEEAKFLIELFYKSKIKLSNLEISSRFYKKFQLYISETTIRRKRRDLVEQIFKWNENESF